MRLGIANTYIARLKSKAHISQVMNACLNATKDCNFVLIYMTDSHIKCKANMTFFSWGEEIDIILKQTYNDVEVEISSRPIAQFFDWGKSKKNVECILSELKNYLNMR